MFPAHFHKFIYSDLLIKPRRHVIIAYQSIAREVVNQKEVH